VRLTGGELLSIEGLGDLVGPGELPPAYRVHGRRAHLTLLHPWANRVFADAFEVAGRSVRMVGDEVGRDPDGVALHGLRVPGAWEVDGASARGRFEARPAFPWAHEVRVRVDGVTVRTELHARDEPVPVAFGWHPYLRLHRRDAVLEVPGIERGPLGERTFDCGLAVPEDATLAIGAARVRLGGGYRYAQVFAPGDADVVSLEPMTAPADALRTGEGLRFARPGEPFVATFALA
jgi:galactose mutarotase-like enzyme